MIIKRVLIASIGLTFFAALLPRPGAAAVLSPSVSGTTAALGSVITVDVLLDSQGDVINAVEAVLRYDPDQLLVLDVSRGKSFLTLWAEEPHLVRPGEIALAGGIPDGSLVVGGNVVSLTFKTLRTGPVIVQVDSTRSGVYRHDGFGSPASLETPPLSLTVEPPSTFAPRLSSASHPLQGVWYRDNTFLVDWTVHSQSVISYLLTRDPNAEPQLVQDNTGHTSFPNLRDGSWFFFFKERLSGDAWSPTTRLEVRVDATPPEPFSLEVVRDNASGKYLVVAAPFDRTSGIASQRLQIFRASFWKPWQARIEDRPVDGLATLDDLKGVKNIVVIAVDNAGNSRSATWYSPNYRDQTRWLILLVLGGLLVLSLLLLAVVSHRLRRVVRRKT